MMLILRMLAVLLSSRRRPRTTALEEISTPFRVRLGDLDVNMHMNNGRYLTLMDLGRLDYLLRLGILGEVLRRRWFPVVGSAFITYVRSLEPRQKYELKTRLAWWDEKWFYMEQRFEAGGRVMATAVIRGLFRGPGGQVVPADLLSLAGEVGQRPEMPPSVRGLLASIDSLK